MRYWISLFAPLLIASTAMAAGPGKSPQATFETLQTAMKSNDHKTFFKCVEPAAQDELLLGMMVGTAFLSMGKEPEEAKKIQDDAAAILKKHNVDNSKELNLSGDEKQMREAATALFANVKDKPGLYQDLMSFITSHANKKNEFGSAKLSEVKVEGDRASATIERPDGKKVPVTFVQVKGQWYLSGEGTKSVR